MKKSSGKLWGTIERRNSHETLLGVCRDVVKTLKSDSHMKVFNHYRPYMIKVLSEAIKLAEKVG